MMPEEKIKYIDVLKLLNNLIIFINDIKPEQKNIEIIINESYNTYISILKNIKEILEELDDSEKKKVQILYVDLLLKNDINKIINLDRINTKVGNIFTFGNTYCTNPSDSNKYCDIKNLSVKLKDIIEKIKETYKELEPIKKAQEEATKQAKAKEEEEELKKAQEEAIEEEKNRQKVRADKKQLELQKTSKILQPKTEESTKSTKSTKSTILNA